MNIKSNHTVHFPNEQLKACQKLVLVSIDVDLYIQITINKRKIFVQNYKNMVP